MQKRKILVSLPPTQVNDLDARKGSNSRSALLESIINKVLACEHQSIETRLISAQDNTTRFSTSWICSCGNRNVDSWEMLLRGNQRILRIGNREMRGLTPTFICPECGSEFHILFDYLWRK